MDFNGIYFCYCCTRRLKKRKKFVGILGILGISIFSYIVHENLLGHI